MITVYLVMIVLDTEDINVLVVTHLTIQ